MPVQFVEPDIKVLYLNQTAAFPTLIFVAVLRSSAAMEKPSPPQRIFLSPPDVGELERNALLRAFDSNWIAPVGPELSAFEKELAAYTGTEACAALSSGSAALHLALLDAGVGSNDEVVVQSATFAATAFAVIHAGATPIFCDSEPDTWGLDPNLLETFLKQQAATNQLPAAVVTVDLYGSCADYDQLTRICAEYEVPLIEDAAEALGSSVGSRQAGSFGRSAALSFNGNKIMTTSGGGALLGSAETIERSRYLATQARQPFLHYEHADIGYNYRMSNLLAALGRAQLAELEPKIKRRQQIHDYYQKQLPQLNWCPFGATDRPNHWLTVGLLPEGFQPTKICKELETQNIEARPAWKPMHLQPVFAGNEMIGGDVSEHLFAHGICLPSGSSHSDETIHTVVNALTAALTNNS